MTQTTVESTELEFTGFATAITPRLFRTALLMCGDWHLAEDLVETTLAKVYVKWSRVARADVPEAYARGVLTKTFLSHKRVRRNAELPSLDLGADHGRLQRRGGEDRRLQGQPDDLVGLRLQHRNARRGQSGDPGPALSGELTCGRISQGRALTRAGRREPAAQVAGCRREAAPRAA